MVFSLVSLLLPSPPPAYYPPEVEGIFLKCKSDPIFSSPKTLQRVSITLKPNQIPYSGLQNSGVSLQPHLYHPFLHTHTSMLRVPQTSQTHSCLKAFALTAPSTEDVLFWLEAHLFFTFFSTSSTTPLTFCLSDNLVCHFIRKHKSSNENSLLLLWSTTTTTPGILPIPKDNIAYSFSKGLLQFFCMWSGSPLLLFNKNCTTLVTTILSGIVSLFLRWLIPAA